MDAGAPQREHPRRDKGRRGRRPLLQNPIPALGSRQRQQRMRGQKKRNVRVGDSARARGACIAVERALVDLLSRGPQVHSERSPLASARAEVIARWCLACTALDALNAQKR